jgi:hypothetical protein
MRVLLSGTSVPFRRIQKSASCSLFEPLVIWAENVMLYVPACWNVIRLPLVMLTPNASLVVFSAMAWAALVLASG